MVTTDEKQGWWDKYAIWFIRLILFGFPCLIAWVGWWLSGHLFDTDSASAIERAIQWAGAVMGLTVLLQLFNILAIELPRARKKKRFWAEKRSAEKNG